MISIAFIQLKEIYLNLTKPVLNVIYYKHVRINKREGLLSEWYYIRKCPVLRVEFTNKLAKYCISSSRNAQKSIIYILK